MCNAAESEVSVATVLSNVDPKVQAIRELACSLVETISSLLLSRLTEPSYIGLSHLIYTLPFVCVGHGLLVKSLDCFLLDNTLFCST